MYKKDARRTVFKYPLNINIGQEVTLPCMSSVVHVGQDAAGQLCLWAEHNALTIGTDSCSVQASVGRTGGDVDLQAQLD